MRFLEFLAITPTAATEPVTPDRVDAISKAPPMGAPLEILPEKTRSASRHAGAVLSKELLSRAVLPQGGPTRD
jgi:hypothetical protein